MFSVVYHPEAREEATALPVKIRVSLTVSSANWSMMPDYCGNRTQSPWVMDFLRSARWGQT